MKLKTSTATEKLSRVIMEGHQGDEYDEALSTLAELEDIGWKVRLCLMDTQRALNFLVRKARLPAGQLEQAREILRDIESLLPHNESLFQKVNFLMQAAMGFINIEQNRIIKIFSVVSVVFLPPTLVASSYGMNFEFMPELHWSFGYPGAIVFMMLAGPAPYLYFKRKTGCKKERRLPSLLADAGLASAQPALGIQRIDDKHRQRDPDKAKGHHFILARHFAVERHRQQEHQRWADVLEKPSVESRRRVAAPVKHSKGMVVTTPAAISSRLSDRGFSPIWLVGLSVMPNNQIAATGSSHSVSTSMPVCASTAIFFRTGRKGKTESQPKTDYRQRTKGPQLDQHAAKARSTASHCRRRKRSPRKIIPNKIFTSGLIK